MISEVSGKTSVLEFPKLMFSVEDGAVVYFLREGYGALVHPATNDDEFLVFDDSWWMEKFVDFTGEVILKN